MGKKANVDEITFNYPIPRTLHKKVRQLSVNMDMKVKDIVINALIMYIDQMNKSMGEDVDDL